MPSPSRADRLGPHVGRLVLERHPITCKLGSIASGASDKITIVAKPTSTSKLGNTASVASPTPDPNPANNTAHVTTNVRPGPAALRLTKTASRRTVSPGQAFSFAIMVRSLGPEPALGVRSATGSARV